jgi:hypothetical protein
MAWMYLVEGATGAKPIGPYSDEEFSALIRAGKIKRTTAIAHPTHTAGEWLESGSVKATASLHDKIDAAIEAAKEQSREQARAARQKLLDESKTRLMSYRPNQKHLLIAAIVGVIVIVASYIGIKLLAGIGTEGGFELSYETSESLRRFDDVLFVLAVIAVVASVHALIGAWIGDKLRRQPMAGALLGGAIGIFGWPFIFMLDDRRRRCPKCLSLVHDRATICRSCRSELTTEPPVLPVIREPDSPHRQPT